MRPSRPLSNLSLPVRLLIVCAVAALLAGCGRDATSVGGEAASTPAAAAAEGDSEADATSIGSLEAVALELGTTLDVDGRVAVASERVRASDTVHVSLITVGEVERATLVARWRDAAGTEIAVDEREISATGPAVHTFSRTPETPWAAGRYEVEVMLGDESAGLRAFEVR